MEIKRDKHRGGIRVKGWLPKEGIEGLRERGDLNGWAAGKPLSTPQPLKARGNILDCHLSHPLQYLIIDFLKFPVKGFSLMLYNLFKSPPVFNRKVNQTQQIA